MNNFNNHEHKHHSCTHNHSKRCNKKKHDDHINETNEIIDNINGNEKDNYNNSSFISPNELNHVHEHSELVESNTLNKHDGFIKVDNNSLTNNDYNHSDSSSLFNFDFYSLLDMAVKLSQKNIEFLSIIILLIIWMIMVLFEFFYGFIELKVSIINDSFANFFKSFSFLIAGFSLLFNRIYYFENKKLLKNRIELVGALSNIVFLVIVSLNMCIQALHIATESSEHIHIDLDEKDSILESEDQIIFLKNFYVVKIIIHVIGLLQFSDYILHPTLQIKLSLWKFSKKWKNIESLDYDELCSSKQLINRWNSHNENMHALTINMLSDLSASIIFILCFYGDFDFEIVYMFISIFNLFLITYLSKSLIYSCIPILMQGINGLSNSIIIKLTDIIGITEGVTGIKEIKSWHIQPNEIRCKIKHLKFFIYLDIIKAFGTDKVNKEELIKNCEDIIKKTGIEFKLIIEIII